MELREIVPKGLGRLLDLLDECSAVVEARGLLKDREIPLTVFTPPNVMIRLDVRIYRHHVGELCDRWARSRKLKDLDHPTSAELLIEFSRASLVAPLNRTGAACYSRLFREILPGAVPEVEELDHERWEGEIDEEITRLKRKTINRPRP